MSMTSTKLYTTHKIRPHHTSWSVNVCQVNGFSLENVTHDEAANTLKNTQDFVRLVVAKATPPPASGPMSIMSPRRRAPPFTGL